MTVVGAVLMVPTSKKAYSNISVLVVVNYKGTA